MISNPPSRNRFLQAAVDDRLTLPLLPSKHICNAQFTPHTVRSGTIEHLQHLSLRHKTQHAASRHFPLPTRMANVQPTWDSRTGDLMPTPSPLGPACSCIQNNQSCLYNWQPELLAETETNYTAKLPAAEPTPRPSPSLQYT